MAKKTSTNKKKKTTTVKLKTVVIRKKTESKPVVQEETAINISSPVVIPETPVIETTVAQTAGITSITTWQWFKGEYGFLSAFSAIIFTLGIAYSWGTFSVLIPIGLLAVISGVCIVLGKKDYKKLVADGYVKPLGSK